MVKAFARLGGRWAPGPTALALGLNLSGCVAPMPDAQVARGDIRNAIARGQLTSPKAATVALVSVEGAPAAVEGRFRQALASEAANREITLTDQVSARYLVRGYLSAYPSDSGVTVAYAYDVFDADRKNRQERVADTVEVPANGSDPWDSVGESVVSTLAGRSADELAVALGGTPEARAAGGKVAEVPGSAPPPVN